MVCVVLEVPAFILFHSVLEVIYLNDEEGK